MANRDAQLMWLHDESKTVTVLPYTTLDAIKVREQGETNVNNITQSFETMFNNQVNAVEGLRADLQNETNNLQSQIDNLNLTQTIATPTADGLMSKEDKALLDNLAEGTGDITMVPATSDRLGGIMVGNTLTIDGNGTLNVLEQDKAISDLIDVTITNLADNQILAYDDTSGKWINTSSVGGANNLNDMNDVSVSSPISSQVLKYVVTNEGGYWTNGNIDFTTTTLDSFTDVEITNPTNNQFLVYDATNSKWINSSAFPIASDSTLGLVKVDGTTITIDNNGTISSTGGSSNVADLEDLDNVNISNLTNGQVLKYDSTNSKWVNAVESGNTDSSIFVGTENYLVSSTNRDYNMTYNSNTKPSNLSFNEDTGEITIDVSGSGGDFNYKLCEFTANGDFFENYVKDKKFAFMAEIGENTSCSFYLYDSSTGDTTVLDEEHSFFSIEFEEDIVRSYEFYVKLDTTNVVSIGTYTTKFTPKLIPLGDEYIKVGDGLKLENGVLDTDTLDYDETMAVLGTPTSSYVERQYKKELLWGNATITYPSSTLSDYTLSEDFNNYDVLEIVSGFNTSDVYCIETHYIDAELLDNTTTASSDTDFQIVLGCNFQANQWLRLSKGSADNIIHVRYNNLVGIYQIYGIKY